MNNWCSKGKVTVVEWTDSMRRVDQWMKRGAEVTCEWRKMPKCLVDEGVHK